MKKEVKDTIITKLGQLLQEFPHFYLVDVTGLNAEKTSNLRRKCFKSEIKMLLRIPCFTRHLRHQTSISLSFMAA